MENKGLFIVFEGIDGAGTSTQVPLLTKHIKDLYKYLDVLDTHEPWHSEEIKSKLKNEKDPYSSAQRLSELYVDDRVQHTHRIIRPVINASGIVNCDRYKMSTCAYQWVQGVHLSDLLVLHENRGLLTPDLTIYIDVPAEVAAQRIKRRQEQLSARSKTNVDLEKFERDLNFTTKLVNAYQSLAHMAQVDEKLFGRVVIVDGTQSIDKISEEIQNHFNQVYQSWKSSN